MRDYRKSFARLALFLIYFWFGLLKVLGKSPASPLVLHLLSKTLPTFPPGSFLVFFGVFEMLIGVLFLIPRFQKLSITLFALHMLSAFAPLILVPTDVWQTRWVPTLEGQYIIKNLALIALVINL